MRLLIDECLSYLLVSAANELGYEAHHVAHLKRSGTKDRDLLPYILNGDFTFVTNNAIDFRKLYQRVSLHAGLILFIDQLPRLEQARIFHGVLNCLRNRNLTNQVVEITVDQNGANVAIFDLP